MMDLPRARPAHSPRTVWAWALYDFANSSFTTLIVTFVYATYFTKALVLDASGAPVDGTVLWTRGLALTALLVAVLSPFLGALADRTGTRRGFLLATTALCITATVGLFFPVPGQALAALGLFVVANVAFELSSVFYNSFLPDIAPADKIGRISGWGWALGYAGGLIALVLALVLLIQPETPAFGLDAGTQENVRATALLVAVWFAVFSVPAFLVLRDPPVVARPALGTVLRETAGQLAETFRELRRYREAFRFLVARVFYNDGLNTIFSLGGVYAGITFGFTTAEVITFGIALNVAAGLGAFGFGFIDDRIGGKRTILISIAILAAATLVATFAPDRTLFWAAGLAIGVAAGPAQAASRSLVGRLTPPDKETEFFGFFALTGKAAALLGPFLFGVMTDAFDTQRAGVATVLAFFLVGGLLLLRVDERAGVAAAGRESA